MSQASYWPRKRMGLMLPVLMLAVVLGGCSSDDDGGGGGGGSKISPPPTARPTLTGMSTLIDVSGGNGTGGAGGSGGSVFLVASRGGFGVGGSAPGIDNNFLTAGVLADNTVSYAELSGISAGQFYLDTGSSTAHFDLFGIDFYLPAGATLDLSDATAGTVDTVVIRTHGGGDVIRIDGIVVTGRAANANVDLQMLSGNNSGVGVAVTGTINADGATGQSGGSVGLTAELGHVLVTGSITARGSAAATGLGGGDVSMVADWGNLYLAAGMFAANGGSGTSSGGSGGDLDAYASGISPYSFPWGFRANGGQGGTGAGGSGGGATMELGGVVSAFTPIETNGGNSTSGNGGSGGGCAFNGGVLKGVVLVHALGGDGGGNGGNGGTVQNQYGASFESFALEADLSGGDGNNGGAGGDTAMIAYAPAQQVLIDVTANGGAGSVTNGGAGGGIQFLTVGVARNITVEFTANGGNGVALGGNGGLMDQTGGYTEATAFFLNGEMNGGQASSATGIGGNGGQANLLLVLLGGYPAGTLTADITALGGDAPSGTQGGTGGVVVVEKSLANEVGNGKVNVTADLTGGASGASGGNGGAGGTLALDGTNGALGTIEATLNVTANGGTSVAGTGGDGGQFIIDSSSSVVVSGMFTGNGGAATGAAGVGGVGGTGDFNVDSFGVFRTQNLSVYLMGGDSEQSDGGDGGTIDSSFTANVWMTGGEFNTSGGEGSTVSGTGVGGQGDDQLWASDNFDMYINSTFRANGGDGAGGGGSAGLLEFTPDENDDGPGAYILFEGLAEARGGNATVNGNGGNGSGEIIIDNYDNSPSYSYAGVSEFRGTMDASGGNGAGTGNGGSGGYCDVDTNGDRTYANGTIRVNGGTGVTGGAGGSINVYADDDGTVGQTVVECYGALQANGGNGTTTGGDGGSIAIYGNDADVTVGATVTVNGGTGTTGGDAGQIDVGFDSSATVTLTSSARLYANGGATDGDGGTINLDPTGAGPANPNLVESAGSVVQANADGAGAAGAINRD